MHCGGQSRLYHSPFPIINLIPMEGQQTKGRGDKEESNMSSPSSSQQMLTPLREIEPGFLGPYYNVALGCMELMAEYSPLEGNNLFRYNDVHGYYKFERKIDEEGADEEVILDDIEKIKKIQSNVRSFLKNWTRQKIQIKMLEFAKKLKMVNENGETP